MHSIPCLGTIDSLRFGSDVDAFLAAGRRLGSPWAFNLYTGRLSPASLRVTVFSEPGVCRTLLRAPGTVMAERRVLGEWLGYGSPIAAEGTIHEAARALTVQLWEPAAAHTERLAIGAIPDAVRHTKATIYSKDLADVLRSAILWWLIPWLSQAPEADTPMAEVDRTAERVRAAERWLSCSDTPAVVLPPLRLCSPRWWAQGPAARVLDRLMGVEPGSPDADAIRTLILGAVDAPVALALEAIHRWATVHRRDPQIEAAAVVDEVLAESPPIPLILRQAERDLEIARAPSLRRDPFDGPIELGERVLIRAGEAFAVDAGRADLPFGVGHHACIAGQLGRTVAVAALHAVRRHGGPVAPGERGRTRLVHGWRRYWLG